MKTGRKLWLTTLAGSVLLAGGARANDQSPAPPQSEPVVLRGATIHPVSGPEIPAGEIVFEHGKITGVGRDLALPDGAKIVDVTGKHVYPGLISAHTVRGSADLVEAGAVNPNARAQVAINPDSELLPVARSNGILTALVVPKTGDGLISGLSTLVHLDGWTWESMTVKADVGLHVFWPELTINKAPRFPVTPDDQQKAADARRRQLQDAFDTARAYRKALETGSNAPVDVRFAAMLPVLRGELPVFVHARDIQQIQGAVRWAADEHLKVVIVGRQNAWRVTDLLKEHDVPVIVSPVNALPLRRWEGYDTAYANPGRLQAAGVRFCIANDGSDFEAAHERNLPYQAAQAAYIDGRPVDLSNRQTRLYDKYKRKDAP